jgi:16S rRNA (cytosine967-C5)-methyltransferase
VLASAAFAEGRLTVQGETAVRAAEALQARAGEELLDLCSAPGGKSAVLAATGARVIALDKSARRQALLLQGLERLRPAGEVRALACLGTQALAPSASFDGVLVDAPCSNTGVLGRRPEARWRWGPATRTALTEVQTELFEAGARRVRPGGRLVWSTCSLEPEENGQRVRTFLAEHEGWTLEEEFESLPASGAGGIGAGGSTDGGYAARLRRLGGTIAAGKDSSPPLRDPV